MRTIFIITLVLLAGCALRDPQALERWNRERAPAKRAFDAQNPRVIVVVQDQ